MTQEKFFKLRGKTLAIIDWANVYGWSEKLKWEVDPEKLYRYLKSYPEIYDIRFYFGVEKGNKKSEEFQERIKEIGYKLISKEVKWIPVSLEISHFKDVDGKIKSIKSLAFEADESHSQNEVSNILKECSKELKKLLSKTRLYRRKCDFDVEITKDILLNVDNFDGLILFSGDGDYKAIVEYWLDIKKQCIVVHPFGRRGREYNELLSRTANRPYFCAVEKLTPFLKKIFPSKPKFTRA